MVACYLLFALAWFNMIRMRTILVTEDRNAVAGMKAPMERCGAAIENPLGGSLAEGCEVRLGRKEWVSPDWLLLE